MTTFLQKESLVNSMPGSEMSNAPARFQETAQACTKAGNRDAAPVLLMHVSTRSDRPSWTHFLRRHARPSPPAVAAQHDGGLDRSGHAQRRQRERRFALRQSRDAARPRAFLARRDRRHGWGQLSERAQRISAGQRTFADGEN